MLLELEGLSKSYEETLAVNNLTFNLEKGVYGLLGPNGAGKSTLIRLLLGLVRPSSGTAKVFGFDSQTYGLRIRERVGYMPEHQCLIPDMSAVAFVTYMGRISGLPRIVSMQRAHDVLRFVGLEDERYREIKTYSSGMLQRVKLAQALVHDPELLIFDEPTTGMDPNGRVEMLNLIKDVASLEGKNIIMSSHLLGDIEFVCSDVVILKQGELLKKGNIHKLLEGEQEMLNVRIKGDEKLFTEHLEKMGYEIKLDMPDILVRTKGEQTYQDVFKAAVECGFQVRQIGQKAQSLESLFIDMLGVKE